ncbi:unnamed protein product [Sphacelaria rigidula]
MSTVLLRQHFIVRLRVPAKTARTTFSHHNSHQSRHASVASTTNPSTIPASTPTRSEKSATANIQQERNLHVVPIAQSRTSTERKNVGSLSFNNDGKSGKLQQSVVGNGSVGENRAVDAAPERRKNSVEKSIGATRGYGSSSARPAVGLSNGTVRQWADAAPSPTRVDAVVIGAGQAGLSVAYHLQKAGGLRFVTLDANQEPGGAWRHRWPSLQLFSTRKWSSLPGYPMFANGACEDGYPSTREMAMYMEEYESVMKLDVVRPVTVTGVKRTAMGTYLVETDCLMGGAPAQWECRAVISGKSVLLSSCVRVFVYSPPRLPMIIFPFFFPCFIPLSPSILFFSLFSSSPSIPNFSPSVLPSIFLNPSVFFFPFFSHSFSSFHVSCSSTFFSPLVAPPLLRDECKVPINQPTNHISLPQYLPALRVVMTY